MTDKRSLPGPDDVQRVQLANGITVLVRENFSSPAVVVNGRLRSGALLEADNKAGLASFHSGLLTRGTKKHTFTELFEAIESVGASLSVGAGGHTYSLSSKSLAEDLPLMLNLLAEVLREPTFPEDHVEKLRGQIMTGLQMREHNTRSMASLTFHELAYPEHPYGLSNSGYLETISSITRDDILAFHETLGPQEAIIAVVGAIKANDAIEMVKNALGDWHNDQQPLAPFAPDIPAIDRLRAKKVDIPGKTQTDLVMGTIGPRRSAPDFQAARMANNILGVFGMYGRLGDSVRKRQGLAYYSYSHLAGGLGPGPWQVIAGVAPDKVDLAVNTIRDEIRRLQNELVSDDELADNKSYHKGKLVLGLEMNEGVAGTLVNMELHQLGLDYLHNYTDMIDGITAESVQAAAQKYLNADAYALGVAGPPDAE